jgi:hypothetical protein
MSVSNEKKKKTIHVGHESKHSTVQQGMLQFPVANHFLYTNISYLPFLDYLAAVSV